VEQADLIWHNGELVAWEDAKIHVLTHGLHYGTSVFEGERCYDTARGPAIFRHQDHLARLIQSARLYYMPLPYTLEELRAATHELIGANGLRECYIRPIAFRGYGQMGINPLDCEVSVSIAVWPWGAYLGEAAKLEGVRAKVSSWRRISGDSLIPHAKAGGQYLNSVLAKIESIKAGYQESILLDNRGFVCEGSGENIYIVKDGEVITPPQTASILDGISRKSILTIARDLGYPVVERDHLVWIWMGDPAKADPAKILDFPYMRDTGWRGHPGYLHYDANYLLIVDNLSDFAHLAFVDGRPVGFAMSAVAPEGLLLGGSGVLASARGRGAYRALLSARWESAVALGTPVLVIQAGMMSRPILERCGFEQVCRIEVLEDPAMGRGA